MIPGFFESFTAIHADVEHHHGATGFASEHDRTGLGDIARATWAVDGKRAIESFS